MTSDACMAVAPSSELADLRPARRQIERYDLTRPVSVSHKLEMARLTPRETLGVFEVACRHGSYSEAARELHVTHSAVSQRIRQLEEELGITLFQRQGNRMMPTSSGVRLQAGVKNAFSELSASLGSIKTYRTDAEITVSLLPVMAARWLVPRLPRFRGRVPNINLPL